MFVTHKTTKNQVHMKPLHILFIALTCFFFSCEQETIETQEEANLTVTTATATRANIKTGRTKIKERRNGLYKTVVVVEDDPENEVATVEVLMPPQNGMEANPSTMTLELRNTNDNGNKRFVFNQLNIDGEDPVGQSLQLTVTQKDAAGENVGEPETIYVTAQDNDMINMTTPTLKINEDGETFTFKIAATGTLSPEVANVNVHLTQDDGGSDADPEEFDLELIRETENKRVFKAQEIEFVESGNVIDMEYIAVFTFFDTNGEELDYAEFRIVGLE